MVTVLPTFKGFSVDMRNRQFRKVVHGETMECIPFDSPEGQKILRALLSFAFEIVDVAKGVLDLSQQLPGGGEQDSKASPDFRKIELFYLCDSLDNYFDSLEPGFQDVEFRLTDLMIGLRAAQKLSRKIPKELRFRADAEK